MASQFRFVAVTEPTGSASPQSKKLAFSHAFRHAHARRRRDATKAHDEKRHNTEEKGSPIAAEKRIISLQSQVVSSQKDPFMSLARPLSVLEQYLLHQYVHVVVPFTAGHCRLFSPNEHSEHQLLRGWVNLTIADDALMVAAILLSTCRYLLRFQPGNLALGELALQYKQTGLQSLLRETAKGSRHVSVMTVAKALALAMDEVATGEEGIARKHLQGVTAMVDSRGGAGAIGLSGLLERIYHRFLQAFGRQGPEPS